MEALVHHGEDQDEITRRALERTPHPPLKAFVTRAPDPACPVRMEYDLMACRTCEVNGTCVLSAYQRWNISAGRSVSTEPRKPVTLLEMVDGENYVLDPVTGERLLHPRTGKTFRVLVPARWPWSGDWTKRNDHDGPRTQQSGDSPDPSAGVGPEPNRPYQGDGGSGSLEPGA